MKICDYSSNDFQSDIRLTSDKFDSLVLSVASKRCHFRTDLPLPLDWEATPTQWVERQQHVRRLLAEAITAPIEHPAAGRSFRLSSYDHCLRHLYKLQREGLRVPQSALDYVSRRIEELASSELTLDPVCA